VKVGIEPIASLPKVVSQLAFCKKANINLKFKNMGFFTGLTELAISPIKIVSKTFTNVVDDDWEAEDAFTLGLTKVAKAVKDEAEEIEDSFKK